MVQPSLKIDDEGMVRFDGVCAFRLVLDDEVRIQVADRDRLRSHCRGTRFIEIPIWEFLQAVDEWRNKKKAR